MAIQTTDDHLARVSRPSSDSARSRTGVAILPAACLLLAALVAFGLLARYAPAHATFLTGADDNGAWIVGP